MPLVKELMNGGVVTVREATMLREGELQQADECVYRKHDPAIYSAPGRTQYNTTIITDQTSTAGAVKGLAHLTFDRATDQIIATCGTRLWGGNFTAIDGTATFAVLTGPGLVSCTTNGTSTLTSSAGFGAMVPGARIFKADVPDGTVVKSVTNSSTLVMSASATGSTTSNTAFDMGIEVALSNTGTEQLDVVQWSNVYYALVAGSLMQRIYFKGRSLPDGSSVLADLLIARPAGLDPVSTAPTATRGSGAGHSWSSVLQNGYYWFLVTEVFNPGQPDEVEGTYANLDPDPQKKLLPVVISITDYTTQDITITRPTQVNNATNGRLSTHWYIYMAKSSDGVNPPSYALFRRVAQVPMSTTSFTLHDTGIDSRQSNKTPSAVAAVAGRNQFTNPTRMQGAPDGLVASGSSRAADSNGVAMQKLQTFGFSGTTDDNGQSLASSTVTGVGVAIRAIGFPVSCGGYFYLKSGSKTTNAIWFEAKGLNPTYYRFGDIFDTFGVNWTVADFTNANGFEVWVETAGAASTQTLGIDSVQVTVYYTGNTINLNGPSFRVVTYQSQIGTTIDDPANLPPPAGATTGDLFQGGMVTNDPSNKSLLRFSLPGYPEYFPRPYQLALNTKKKDIVNYIRRVGQVLVVGLRDSIERVNYLPTESDTAFQEGLSHEPLANDHGIPGPLAGTLFTFPGSSGEMLAYASTNGFYVTDGVSCRYLNTDLDWAHTVDLANIGNCWLVNYPKENWLVLYYAPYGGNGTNTKALVFCYAPDKIKEGGTLPAIGPISVSARSACSANLNGTPIVLTGHLFGGKIYTEDQGDTIPTGYNTDGSTQIVGASVIRTRLFYPSNLDRLARAERIYIEHSAKGSTALTATAVMTAGSTTVTSSGAFTNVLPGMMIVSTNIPGDAVVVSKSDASTIVISHAPFETVTDSVTFDTGVLAVTVRSGSIGIAVADKDTGFLSMTVGGLRVVHPDTQDQALELKIQKSILPDGTLVNLFTGMRLHYFAYDMSDGGKEQNRVSS